MSASPAENGERHRRAKEIATDVREKRGRLVPPGDLSLP